MMTLTSLTVPVLLVALFIQGYSTKDVFPSYKLQHWRFRDSVLSFPHNPSAIFPLASSQQKLKAAKPRTTFTSVALPSILYPSIKKNEVHVEAVNKLVDRASAASIHAPSYPKYRPGKSGPPHYPPLNRKALYATGLIYLRDFRPGGPLYRK